MLSKAVRVQNKSLLNAAVSSPFFYPTAALISPLYLRFVEGKLRYDPHQEKPKHLPQVVECCRHKNDRLYHGQIRSIPGSRGK
jgi:hypothetical protein